MEKPGPDDPIEAHFTYGMRQIADERKERCVHCGAEWYAIHYKDGVCHSCQQKHLPGRTVLVRRETRRLLLRRIAVIALVYGLVLLAVVRFTAL